MDSAWHLERVWRFVAWTSLARPGSPLSLARGYGRGRFRHPGSTLKRNHKRAITRNRIHAVRIVVCRVAGYLLTRGKEPVEYGQFDYSVKLWINNDLGIVYTTSMRAKPQVSYTP